MARLTRYSIPDIAGKLGEPFSVANIAYVDDLLVSVYICDGTLQWHRHVDRDELFWVHEGAITLESKRGNARLAAGELAVVPKGTEHRSRSSASATVLLLRCGLVPHRKNGKRQLYAAERSGLPHISLYERAEKLVSPFRFQTVAHLEDARVQLAHGAGRWPIELPVVHDRMVYVAEGSLTVRTVRDKVCLRPGDFTVVPRGAFYHLHTEDDTLLVRVTREAL